MTSFPRKRATMLAWLPPPGSPLSVQIRHRVGSLELNVDFKLTKPWTILFGPSGSGKSTILRTLAGLIMPDHGCITSFPRPKDEDETHGTIVDTEAGIFVPPHLRGMPLAAQRAALFPSMTVEQNIRYGFSGVDNAGEADKRNSLSDELPQLFRIGHLLSRRPLALSGGEAQRVSMARAAMARRKRFLLLDEPFTALDRSLRDSVIEDFRAWQAKYEIPILSVTHDVGEAFQLGAEVIKIADGEVVAQGPVEVVLAEERAELLRQLNTAVGSPG